MHIMNQHSLIAAVLALLTGYGMAADFSSGSNGSYGPMVITDPNVTMIDLPPDGILHCTTIHVAAGSTLRFRRNSANTPVYLLATGDVTIDGAIDVSAAGPLSGQ
jgi:hypothetical protein